jgi:predicted nucleic acid-binding protein
MPVLVDTSVLLRVRDAQDPRHPDCRAILEASAAGRHALCIVAQVMIEYWVVATRPPDRNGFGLSPAEAAGDLAALRAVLPCLPEPPDVADRWLRLVTQHGVSGKPAHDTRLVAVMEAHGIGRLLTLNPSDFARFTGIEVVSPNQLLTTGT